MSTQMRTEESNLLVMFPASKNFAVEELHSYSTPNYLDERFDNDEIEITSEEVFPSLEAFMARNKLENQLTKDDHLVIKINEQMKMISEANERIKFYMDEIEMFMPKKR